VSKQKVEKLFVRLGVGFVVLGYPLSSFLRSAETKLTVYTLISYAGLTCVLIALSLAILEAKRKGLPIIPGVMGYAMLLTYSYNSSSHPIAFFYSGIALIAISLIWTLAPQFRTAAKHLRADYKRISQQKLAKY